MRFQKEELVKVINSIKSIDRKWIKFLIIKEFSKILLFPVFFMLLHPLLAKVFRYWYGLEEYLKHDILRLFVDSYYISTAFFYGHPTDVYFNYITNHLHVELYLWIIPFIMSLIYSYLSYWIIHKIVDRTGIGATQKLSFTYFFFIFGISNIFFRILIYDYNISYIPYPLMWYIIYKTLKISVLKIKEKTINKGESNV